ncbi:hypothetical protein [Sphingosinicella sp. CPCC 101087]|nr:hypothetical protein [Sphingosinicella sp. CPCC 101087]
MDKMPVYDEQRWLSDGTIRPVGVTAAPLHGSAPHHIGPMRNRSR